MKVLRPQPDTSSCRVGTRKKLLPDVPVVVLIGGEGRRFGSRKELMPLEGVPLLVHIIDQAACLGKEILLVGRPSGNGSSAEDLLLPGNCKIHWLEDGYPEKTPISGILTAIEYLSAFLGTTMHSDAGNPVLPNSVDSAWFYLLSCDILFNPPDYPRLLLEALLSDSESHQKSGNSRALKNSDGFCGAVFTREGMPQPFPGLYSTDTLSVWKAAYAAGNFRLQSILQSMELKMISEESMVHMRSVQELHNINTPQHLASLSAALRERLRNRKP